MHVMENGSVRKCVFIPYTVGNIRREGLNEIWRRLIRDRLIAKLKDPRELKGVCGGCRARAYLVKGDLFASDLHLLDGYSQHFSKLTRRVVIIIFCSMNIRSGNASYDEKP